MSSPLSPGLSSTREVEVTEDLSPPHLAPTVVLSTPEMIRLMEDVSTRAVQTVLDAHDQTTVGTQVDVSHESAARQGERVTVTATLENVDGSRLAFAVEARVGDRIVGRGTHRRYVVDRSRFSR
jgi:fluoroacetyl-CoA thioesterase